MALEAGDTRPDISDGRFDDVDALAAQFRGYGQVYQQLGRGRFEGRVRAYRFGDDLMIQQETANCELAQSAWTPTGRYAACILAATSPPCTLNAASFAQNDLAVCPENRCIEGKTAAGLSIYCLDLATDLLPDEAYAAHSDVVAADPMHARRLREVVESGLHAFATRPEIRSERSAVISFKSSIADLLWQIATRTSESAFRDRRPLKSIRTLRTFRRAREFIHERLADGISISELCRDIGVSRRSLEGAFQSAIGMSPGNFIRLLQLNHIRRDLVSGPSDAAIGAIAARRGVWHLSRFSQAYRELFGELPSQTRRRAQESSSAVA